MSCEWHCCTTSDETTIRLEPCSSSWRIADLLLSKLEARNIGVDKVTVNISLCPGVEQHPYLLNASTTMNIALSKGASGGSTLKSSYLASPERKGLYGKKPLAKVNIAMGINTFARARRPLEVRADIVLACRTNIYLAVSN